MPWWTLVGLSFMNVGPLGFATSVASAAPAHCEGCDSYTPVMGSHVTVRALKREDTEMYDVSV